MFVYLGPGGYIPDPRARPVSGRGEEALPQAGRRIQEPRNIKITVGMLILQNTVWGVWKKRLVGKVKKKA